MRSLACLSACFLLPCSLVLAQNSSRPDFSGTWQFNSTKSEVQPGGITPGTWMIQQKDGTIHLSEMETGKRNRKIEWQCSTDGKDCDVAAGDKAKASFWFNGPLLVEMETKGEKTTRYRMKLSEDGKTLNVNVTSIVPRDDKSDLLYFEKQP